MKNLILKMDLEKNPAGVQIFAEVPYYRGRLVTVSINDVRSGRPFYILDGARHDLTQKQARICKALRQAALEEGACI